MKSKKDKSPPHFYAHPKKYFAWFIWAVCVLFIFFILLVESSIWYAHSPLINKQLTKGFNYNTIFDPFLITIVILQIPVGYFIDETGPRRAISLVMLISAIGMTLLGLSYSPILTWVSLLIVGLGGTVTYASALKMVANWFFPKQFALMVGWTACIAHLGSALGQFLNQFLFSHFNEKTVIINYSLIGMIYALFFFLILGSFSQGIKYDIYANQRTSTFKEAIKEALKNRENWFIALFFGLVQGHRIPFVGLEIPIFNTFYHISPDAGVKVNMYNLFAFAIGLPFFGWLSTRYTRRKMLITIGTIISSAMFLIPIYLPYFPPIVMRVFFIISAFFAGTAFLAFTMIHERNIPHVTATVVGLLVVAMAFFHFVTGWFVRAFNAIVNIQPIKGLSGFTSGDFKILLIIFPISIILGLFFLSFTKETYGKQRLQ